MTYITEWVRGLVILVLLAACLELLLPVGGMKKYVKLVMGLVVVLAVLRPIAEFLGRPVALDVSALTGTPDRSLPTIDQIMADAGEFRQRNLALMSAEAQERLAAEARQAALGVAGVAEAQAAVTLDQAVSAGADPKVTAVTVTVAPGKEPGAIRRVEPVRSGSGAAGTGTGGGGDADRTGAAAASAPAAGAETVLAEAVRQGVASRLGLQANPQIVRVLILRGQGSQRR